MVSIGRGAWRPEAPGGSIEAELRRIPTRQHLRGFHGEEESARYHHDMAFLLGDGHRPGQRLPQGFDRLVGPSRGF